MRPTILYIVDFWKNSYSSIVPKITIFPHVNNTVKNTIRKVRLFKIIINAVSLLVNFFQFY